MKALLLRVGIDKGYGGCLAPIFRDGSFEYIPIPERRATSESRHTRIYLEGIVLYQIWPTFLYTGALFCGAVAMPVG